MASLVVYIVLVRSQVIVVFRPGSDPQEGVLLLYLGYHLAACRVYRRQ
jgi:hypothetical protein